MLTADSINLMLACVAVFLATRILNYFKYARQTGHLPGLRSLATPISVLGASFPTNRFNPGLNWQWEWRKEVYHRYGCETISSLPYLFGEPAIYTSSIEVARQIVSTRGSFVKSPDITAITTVWGPNLFAANGEDWKRFRRIITPAFDHATYVGLWKETSRVYHEMVSREGWEGCASVDIPNFNPLSNKLALILISSSGFGHSLSWDLKGASSLDKMSFGEALHIITHNLLLRLILPRWAYWLPVKRFQDLEMATRIVEKFMGHMIQSRRQELASGASPGSDVLSLMIQSAESEGKFSMTDEELIGNTAILLFAGHETTAMTLNATLGFMAIHPEFQDEMYEEVMSVMPTVSDSTLANSYKLRKVLACFLEASRMFPAGFMWIRDTAEDTILENVGPNRDERIMVPRGTRLVVDGIGLHHNPRLFPDPEDFKPERWYDTHENAPTMFSLGPRVCIGKRFATMEAVCFLSNVVRDWRVEAYPRNGESKEDWERSYMRGRAVTNFGVADMPIRFVRRA